MNYYFQAWKKAFDFKGRARRKEFFTFAIINGLIVNILFYMDNEISLLVGWLVTVVYIVPMYAVTFRRLHDQDKSGWWMFVPIYGMILTFIDGTEGENNYGPDPKLQDFETDPESMAARSPVSRPSEPWQCSKCNTRNAAEVTECATCGRSLS